ncbi:formate/nitrite transporter family protein [Haloterrigena salifodinae]|uniref:formate/nitrite transporter family protein n=1 Tax=Haloterrigena salifodinae TaxID=2675099 RepID=UPI000F86CD17|nr:formate/nitrite transporter family protein [Haloterrigena salifodinae]
MTGGDSPDEEETGENQSLHPDKVEERFRDALDHAQSGAPAAGAAVRDWFSTDEIFQRVVATAEEEIDSSSRELFYSGLAAGFAITLTFLGHAAVAAAVPGEPTGLLAATLYPIGFLFIVMGRYQLFTENTLPPVTLVLTRIASLPLLLRLWMIVLVGNVLGATMGALVLAKTGVFTPESTRLAVEFGLEAVETPWWDLFFKAIFAGWLVAGMVWLNHATRDSTARLLLIYGIIYMIPATGLHHVVVTSCEAMYLVFSDAASLAAVTVDLFLPVLLGNTIGGVVLVALLNYAQTRERRFPKQQEREAQLTRSEWLFGSLAGRSRVPPATEAPHSE